MMLEECKKKLHEIERSGSVAEYALCKGCKKKNKDKTLRVLSGPTEGLFRIYECPFLDELNKQKGEE